MAYGLPLKGEGDDKCLSILNSVEETISRQLRACKALNYKKKVLEGSCISSQTSFLFGLFSFIFSCLRKKSQTSIFLKFRILLLLLVMLLNQNKPVTFPKRSNYLLIGHPFYFLPNDFVPDVEFFSKIFVIFWIST